VGSVTGFCTILPHGISSLLLWPVYFSVDEDKLVFLYLGRYFQYHITRDDSTCCGVSWSQVSTPAASYQKSPFAALLIDGKWQLHVFPDESSILYSPESAKKMLDCFGLFTMSALKNKRKEMLRAGFFSC